MSGRHGWNAKMESQNVCGQFSPSAMQQGQLDPSAQWCVLTHRLRWGGEVVCHAPRLTLTGRGVLHRGGGNGTAPVTLQLGGAKVQQRQPWHERSKGVWWCRPLTSGRAKAWRHQPTQSEAKALSAATATKKKVASTDTCYWEAWVWSSVGLEDHRIMRFRFCDLGLLRNSGIGLIQDDPVKGLASAPMTNRKVLERLQRHWISWMACIKL